MRNPQFYVYGKRPISQCPCEWLYQSTNIQSREGQWIFRAIYANTMPVNGLASGVIIPETVLKILLWRMLLLSPWKKKLNNLWHESVAELYQMIKTDLYFYNKMCWYRVKLSNVCADASFIFQYPKITVMGICRDCSNQSLQYDHNMGHGDLVGHHNKWVNTVYIESMKILIWHISVYHKAFLIRINRLPMYNVILTYLLLQYTGCRLDLHGHIVNWIIIRKFQATMF